MKNYLQYFLLCLIVGATSVCKAQGPYLWGTTSDAYHGDGGSIFNFDAGTKTEIPYYYFNISTGVNPLGGGLAYNSSNGLFYGLTSQGGVFGYKGSGTLFNFNILTGTYNDLFDFDTSTYPLLESYNGMIPFGGPLIVGNNIVGTARDGGQFGDGLIFEYPIGSAFSGLSNIYPFNGTNGEGPTGSLILASNGVLYGLTSGYSNGGSGGATTLFSYTLEGPFNDFNLLATLPGGASGTLMQASNSLLYGMTENGGTYDLGTIFSYNITTNVLTTLYNFGNGTDGSNPYYGKLLQASNGVLYGMTSAGGKNSHGIIFSYNISTGVETDLYDFGTNAPDGEQPMGSLMQASDGLLYGTTAYSTNDEGAIISYNIATGQEQEVHDFGGEELNPFCDLVEYNPVTAYPSSPVTVCSGATVNMTAYGANSYTWSPAVGLNTTTGYSVSAIPTVTTTYTVSGYINSQPFTKTVVVNVNPLPSTTASASPSAYCGSGSSTLTASGASTYTWSPLTALSATTGSSITADPTVTTTYTVTGTNTLGCSASNTVTVTVNPIPVITPQAFPASYCNGGSSILSASGGSTYTWSPSTGLSATTGSIVTANPTTTTTYTITGISALGCPATTTVTVTVTAGTAPVIVTTSSPSSYCGSGSSTLTASGASTYTWSPSIDLSGTTGSTVIASPTINSTYTVTGTGGLGCTSTAKATITVYPIPTVTAVASPASYCTGGSSTLTASGGSTYTWSPSTALSSTTGSSVTANPTVTTTYTVTGISAAGCVNTNTVTVTVGASATITATALPASYCAGGSSTVNVSGGNTYTWSPSMSLSATTGSSVIASPTISTTYTIIGTSGPGCTGTANVTITVYPIPIVTIAAGTTSLCPGGSTTLTASGASTYSWAPSNYLNITSGSSVIASPPTGLNQWFEVEGYSTYGCSAEAQIQVACYAAATITGSANPLSYCPGGNSALTASGALTYTWSPSIGLSATTGSSVTTTVTTTTTYTITATDVHGCVNTGTVTPDVVSSLDVTTGENVKASCGFTEGNNAFLHANGAATYTWSPATGLSATTGAGVYAYPAVTTIYTVIGSEGTGCTGTASDTLTVYPTPVMTVTINPASICAGGNSIITVSASGSNQYTWSPASGLSVTTGTSVTANPTVSTNYDIEAINSFGCNSYQYADIAVISTFAITASASPASYCSGGSSTLTASGATNYTWSPSTGLNATTGSSVTANPTVTTTYTVTGTNAGGCFATNTVTVTVNPLPTITAAASPISYCPGGSSTLTASGGVVYTWSPSAGLSATTGSIITTMVTTTTTYTVTGTNSSSCVNTGRVTLTVGSSLGVTTTAQPFAYCGTGSSSLKAYGATTYTWSPSTSLSATTGSSVTATPTITTIYTVTGNNGAGCSGVAYDTITVYPVPILVVTATPTSYCPGGSSSFKASGTDQYGWVPSTGLSSTTGSSITASPTVTTTYYLTGFDTASGCNVFYPPIIITVNPNPIITASKNQSSYCAGGIATLTSSGGATYTWSPSTGLSATTGSSVSATPIGTTTYTVTGTNSNGCSATQSVIDTVYPTPVISSSANPSSYCSGGNSTLTASGGSTYTWSPSMGLSGTTGSSVTANPTVTTTYTVTGTNSNGCSSTNRVTVTVTTGITVAASATPASYCSGGSSNLTASGATNYTWSPSTALSATTGSSVTADPTITTTYTVMGTSSGGCYATKTVTMTVNPNPTINASEKPSSYCAGGSSVFLVSGGTTYTWSPSIGLSATTGSSVTASPTVSTVYTVTGKNVYGCSGTKSGKVTVNALPIVSITPSSLPLCNGSSSTLKVSGATTYAWSPSAGLSNTTGTSLTVNPTVTTTYTVSGTNSSGCIGTKTVTVTVNPVPVLSASESPSSICAGSSSVLKVAGATTYTWAPATGLSATTGTSVNADPSITTTYTVTGTNTFGCSAKKSGKLTVNVCGTGGSDMVDEDSSGNTTSGIDQLPGISNQISVYPNPANNSVFVKINSGALNVNEWSLQLIDVLGRTLYTMPSLNYSNEIDLSNLPGGVYFIAVVNKTGKAIVRVVKIN